MEAGVAVNNLFARLDSRNIFGYTFDSPCYRKDNEQGRYTIGTATSVVKVFQRPESTQALGYRTTMGQIPPSVLNQSICHTLQTGDTSLAGSTSYGPAEPRWIRFDPDGGGDCPLGCWRRSTKTGSRTFFESGGMNDQTNFKRKDLPPPLNADTDDIKAVTEQWIAFTKDFGDDMPKNENGTTNIRDIWQLTDRAFMLHPETCSSVHYSENMIFQPCMHNCLTTFGINRCWCNVTVQTDILCNAGQLMRQSTFAALSQARQGTTALISLVADIPGGAVYNMPLGLCDLSSHRHACGAAAAFDDEDQRLPWCKPDNAWRLSSFGC